MGSGVSKAVYNMNPIGNNHKDLTSDSDFYMPVSEDEKEVYISEADKIESLMDKYINNKKEGEDTYFDFYDDIDKEGIRELGIKTSISELKVRPLEYSDIENNLVRFSEELGMDIKDTQSFYFAVMERSKDVLLSINNVYKNIYKNENITDGFIFSTPISEEDSAVLGRTASDVKSGENFVAINASGIPFIYSFTNPLENNFTALKLSSKGSGAVSHELGHALSARLQSKGKALNNFYKSVEKEKLSAVSFYGNVSQSEAFAEAFSLYCFGVKEPTLGKSYYEKFKDFMTDNGLNGFFGCVYR